MEREALEEKFKILQQVKRLAVTCTKADGGSGSFTPVKLIGKSQSRVSACSVPRSALVHGRCLDG
eukprot:6061498-Pleurochrysis_carterae.AAC.1